MVKVREMRVRAPRWMSGGHGGAVRRMSRRDIPTGHFGQAFFGAGDLMNRRGRRG